MCYYFKHKCPNCREHHYKFSSACDAAKGDSICGVQIVVNDEDGMIGDDPCINCRKLPFDPTKEGEPEYDAMDIDQPEEQTMMPSGAPKGKAHLVLPRIDPSKFRKPEDTTSLDLLRSSRRIQREAGEIVETSRLPPLKTAEQATKAEKERLDHLASRVENRKAVEWPKPGQTREQWGAEQEKIRFVNDEVLDQEWDGFQELLRRKEEFSHRKIAIPRSRKP